MHRRFYILPLAVVLLALSMAAPQRRAAAQDGSVVVAAAGDIACATNTPGYNGGDGTATVCRQKDTSDLTLSADAVLTLGDNQYCCGALAQLNAVYNPTWGRMKAVTYPSPGDHDYNKASAYFSYFGVPPYYSFDLGSWHLISLDSEIDHAAGSVQEQWLRDDLSMTTQPCVLAYWGAARFASGLKGSDVSFGPFWDDLYEAKADVVLAGDVHHYERFALQAPDGTAADDGIREFVVGTGGRNLAGFPHVQPNLEAKGKAFGVLQLTLNPTDYSWAFTPVPGYSFADFGSSTSCH